MITDVHMPGLSGYELTRRIRAAEGGQHGPPTYIIGASANAMKQALHEAVAHGMDDYVTKPLSLTDLGDALARAVQHRVAVSNASHAPLRDGTTGSAPSARGQTGMGRPPGLETMLDLGLLEELADGDAVLLDEFLALFLDSAAECIAALRGDGPPGARADVESAAHKLKSSARTIGARRLGDLCAAAEVAAMHGDHATCDGLRAHILHEFETIRAALEAHLRC